jgi:uncharacterized protein (TIGR04222 family)
VVPLAARIRRPLVLLAVLAPVAIAAFVDMPAHAQIRIGERIVAYDTAISIGDDGVLTIVETIDYDFASFERHGIYRDVPTAFLWEPDRRYERIYPLEVVDVRTSGGAPDGYVIESGGPGITRIKIGDPDVTIDGQHRYEITYRVEGALNGFEDHVELYWNAVGTEWSVPIDRATASVEAPASITDAICFAGPSGSTLPCDAARIRGRTARFAGGELGPYEGLTVVVAIPTDAVPTPAPILRERWSLARAYRLDAPRGIAAGGLLLAVIGGLGWLAWTRGRDRLYRGSQVDEVMGGDPALGDRAVPVLDADAAAPVEFEPPADLRPGQIGTLADEEANLLDVTATIVDLAVRGHLVIQEIPKEGWFGKPDWRLVRLDEPEEGLLRFERTLLEGLFRDGSEVLVSSLRTTFVPRLRKVQDALYRDAMDHGWFRDRPDKVRTKWTLIGIAATVLGIAGAIALAALPPWGWVGVPLLVGGIGLWILAGRMPARTAAGTAMLRRARGFRTVIETAETHLSRWAEQENVFTRYLPYAVVFGLTDTWAGAFAGLAEEAPTFYVSSRPFVAAEFAEAIDGFTVTTGGTLATAPPSTSGGSGFSGGGSSGGGGGGGGGGSW